GIAILADPGRPGAVVRVAQHVDERALTDDGGKEIGPLDHDGRDEEPAVGSSDDAELLRARESALLDVGGHGLEIVIGALAMVFQRRLVPGGTELAATADVGHGDGATAGEPGLPCI